MTQPSLFSDPDQPCTRHGRFRWNPVEVADERKRREPQTPWFESVTEAFADVRAKRRSRRW